METIVKEIFDSTIYFDTETKKTMEANCVRLPLPAFQDMDEFAMLLNDYDMEYGDSCDLTMSLMGGEIYGQCGVYDVSKYAPYYHSMSSALWSAKDDTMESRQFVIQFDKEHCFESMHFMIRQKNDGPALIINANLRSCAFDTHFANDLYVLAFFACKFADSAERKFKVGIKNKWMLVNIGSLHIFKEDM